MRGQHLNPKDDLNLLSCDSGWIVGLDEVGAGCLSGPLCVAAFAFPVSEAAVMQLPVRVTDSKKLTPEKRSEASSELLKMKNCVHRLLWIDVDQIEKLNIYWARMKAFWSLIVDLDQLFDSKVNFIVDGPRLAVKVGVTPQTVGIDSRIRAQSKADSTFFSVAAASILAKVARDSFITNLASEFQNYNWDKNKGYATPDHIEAIRKYGLTEHHRKSFCKNFVSSEVALSV